MTKTYYGCITIIKLILLFTLTFLTSAAIPRKYEITTTITTTTVRTHFEALTNASLTDAINKAFPPEMFAAAYGNTSQLAYLLSRWPKPSDGANVKDWVEQTPLHLAAKFGKIETAQLLLSNGARVNVRNRDFDESPLHLAAKSGYIDMVRLLIQNGADVDAAINITSLYFPGGTPMTYAIETANSLDTVGLLVQLGGANVNKANLEKMTPLHLAVKNQNLALVKFLLDSGADIEAKDKEGRSPLNYLVSDEEVRPQLPMIAYLLSRGANIESPDKVGRTPVQGASLMKYKAVVKYLLQRGANINSKGITGRTILHRVIMTKKLRSVDLVRFLLLNGAKPNMGTPDGCNMPLHDFANVTRDEYYNESRSTLLDIARLLISYGADPLYKEPCTGTSPLDLALKNQYVQLVEVFQLGSALEDLTEFAEEEQPAASMEEIAVTFSHIGVDKLEDIVVMMSKLPKDALYERDWLNQTALHVASFFGRAYVSMVLTCFGYDIHAKDGFGRTPLNNAARIGSMVLMEYLLDRRANIETSDDDGLTPLLSAVKYSSSPPAVRLLIQRGANVSAIGKDGLSALHVAAVNQNFEIMEILLAANLSANIKTPYGETVLNYLLHSSCCYPQIPTVGLLLKYGANVNLPDNNGHVPLHGAIASRKGSELILLLLYNGADPNVVDKAGCSSPIQLYVKNTVNDPSLSDEEIANTVQWMISFGANPHLGDKCNNNRSPINLADMASRPLVSAALRKTKLQPKEG